LSADSKRSLELQGGIFTDAEADAFIAQPHAADAVRVRLWDDLAKSVDAVTPPVDRYLALAERLSCR
jgi:predicted HD phosphohydrolase